MELTDMTDEKPRISEDRSIRSIQGEEHRGRKLTEPWGLVKTISNSPTYI